uniref:DNA polymerase n=1 Tax=Fagus sylvatica TaxID=28930 RepID=A0A2N9HA95_FAGSY
MSNNRKRPAPPPQKPSPAAQAPKHHAASQEDEFVDEDIFLDETLLLEDEEILRDLEDRRALASRLSKWVRPPLSDAYISHSRNILFQQLEIDYVIGESHKELLPKSSGSAAIIRIFGVTREGHSVCCHVHGFEPYFYINCPPGMGPDDIVRFHQILEARMRENRNAKVQQYVRRIELVQKRSIMYYQQQTSHPFLKIVVALPAMVPNCRGILDRGIQIDGFGMKSFMTYESNVLFALRFMIDCNIVGGNWIDVPAGKYKKTAKNLSYCQLEFDCLYSELISHAPEGEFSKMAPFRVLSFDIECAGRKGHFPEPNHDPVIQVANLVTLQGEDQPFIRNVMTLKSCSPIVGVDVMSFDTEREVLLAWRDFIREVDPDIIIGYNICKFDLPYLIERAETLGIVEFPILGRIRNSRVRVKDTTFSSRQMGTRESKEVTIEGRVQFDLLQAMQRDYKLSSYSLNSVSAHFLSEQHGLICAATYLFILLACVRSCACAHAHKEDVHHSIISDLQNGNSETRRRLAVYCLKDAYLPQRLLDKLMFIYNYVEMARVTGVPMSFLLSRGQSIKVLSQLLRKAKQRGLVIPNVKQAGSEQGTYEGATVLEARAGFYEKPIATLDFASLYPSIMMAYNLCYCTLVTPEDVRKLNLPPECINKTPSGETFVKSNLQKGILPEILEELITARKRAKADLKEAKDPLVKAVLDGRQLALKISANSVYGFTGATVGQLPCLEISSSVTSYGRQMIEHTKKLVEDKFTMLGGYEHNAEVIYGDTDSVMVQFGVDTVEAAMKLGKEAAEYISGTFIKSIFDLGCCYLLKFMAAAFWWLLGLISLAVFLFDCFLAALFHHHGCVDVIKASLSCIPNITRPFFFSRSFLGNFLTRKAFFRCWRFQFQLVLGGFSTFSAGYLLVHRLRHSRLLVHRLRHPRLGCWFTAFNNLVSVVGSLPSTISALEALRVLSNISIWHMAKWKSSNMGCQRSLELCRSFGSAISCGFFSDLETPIAIDKIIAPIPNLEVGKLLTLEWISRSVQDDTLGRDGLSPLICETLSLINSGNCAAADDSASVCSPEASAWVVRREALVNLTQNKA